VEKPMIMPPRMSHASPALPPKFASSSGAQLLAARHIEG
jgi:hypothetical protein